jgi:acyl-CoA thioester hydrolase
MFISADTTVATPTIQFRWRVRVYWEDTDAGGVVFYANYLKFFERGRTEWLRAAGVSQSALREETGSVFVVTDTSLQYRQPARLDDMVEVTVVVAGSTAARLTVDQTATRIEADGSPGPLLCEGRIRIACVDVGTFRPRRIPSDILEKLLIITP